MKKPQKNKYSMYNGVIAHLEKNSSIYNENEEFVNHRESFITVTIEIGLKEDVRSKATTGKTKEKTVIRNLVTAEALGIAGALCAYAKKSKLITLAESTRLSKSKLENLRDNILGIELNFIKVQANQYSGEIARYGISGEKLNSFVNNISLYSKALGARSSGGALKTGASKSLTTLFREAGILLDSIDRLMENYRDTHKEFYDGYKASRVIKNLGIRHNPEEEPVNPENPVLVEGEGS